MFYKYNYDNFPLVYVEFNNNIIDNNNLNLFLEEWDNIYKTNKEFTLIFNTININIQLDLMTHSFTIINFIKKIKTYKPLLQKSIIIVQNDFIKNILYYIFQIQSPVCITYITKNNNIDDMLKQINFSEEWYSNSDTVKINI